RGFHVTGVQTCALPIYFRDGDRKAVGSPDAVYRVPFQNMVGDQGFYIYQQVYPFIAVFGIWTSYGFAVAVSKMLADSKASEHRRSEERRVGRESESRGA